MKKTMIIDGVMYAVEKKSSPPSCKGCAFRVRGGDCRNENPQSCTYCMENSCIYKKQKQTSAPKKKSSNPTRSTPTPSDPIGFEYGRKIFDAEIPSEKTPDIWKLDLVPIEAIFDHLRSKGYTGTICKTEKIEL